jgi:hypothetical protein
MVQVIDLILLRNRLGNGLGVYDGVNVGGRSETGDEVWLIGLR